jgi:hypothetical protein
VAIRDFDMPPAFERREHHEEIGRAVALAFVIEGRRSFIWIGARISAVNCFEVSSKQTRGISGSRGRVYTASTSSMAATNALLAFGGMTHCCFRCGLRMFF